MSKYPKTIIKDGGFEMPSNTTGLSPVCVFSFAEGQTHKIYWGVTKKEALRRFETFQDEYGEPVAEATLWVGFLKDELLMDNTVIPEIRKMADEIMGRIMAEYPDVR